MLSCKALASCTAFALLLTSARAHAGTDIQGTDIQGTDIQGTDIQGTDIQGTGIQGTGIQGTDIQGTDIQGTGLRGVRSPEPWLQGMELTGVRRGARPSDAAVVSVVGFRGPQIDALVWKPRTGWRRTTLRPGDLAGVEWIERRCRARSRCGEVRYRIVDATPDRSRNTMPDHADNRDIWLYRVQHTTAAQPGERDWKNVCTGTDNGNDTGRGLFVSGRWRDDGAWRPGGYTFSCARGVVAKCARSWGYKPWKRLVARDARAVDLQPLHQACTRAARADYCGDGVSHTRNGTLIDLFDIHGFNVRDASADLAAEAGFDTHGARWVARTRWGTGALAGPRARWLELATCRRPRHAPAGDPATLLVRSDPDLGADTAPVTR